MANRVRKATSICIGLSVVIVASRQSNGKTKTQFGRLSVISGLLFLVALLGMLLPARSYGEQPQTDLAAMQGEWEVHDLTIAGKRVIASTDKNQQAHGFHCTFAGDQWTYVMVVNNKPVSIKFTVHLDSAPNPSTLDAKLHTGRDKGKTCRGIYKIEDKDTLCICLVDKPSTEPPQEFASPDGSDLHLMKLKRVTSRARQ